MTTLALAVLLCMAKPEYEAHPPAQAAGMAGYAAMLVDRRPHRDEEEIKAKPPQPTAPLPNAVKPAAKPDEPQPPAPPAMKPTKVTPEAPQQGYWRTECNGGSCRRVWVHGGQPARTYHYRGLFRRR